MNLSVTETFIETSLEWGAWGIRDVRRYGQPNHDFETGHTQSGARHGGGVARVRFCVHWRFANACTSLHLSGKVGEKHVGMQFCAKNTFSRTLPFSETIQVIGTVNIDDVLDNEMRPTDVTGLLTLSLGVNALTVSRNLGLGAPMQGSRVDRCDQPLREQR